MASADVREELNCSICLDVYKDPVTLRCGHNFCRVCIDRVLDAQERSGGYTCPDCRDKIQDRCALYKNITLHNIAERFLLAKPSLEGSGIFCTYCDSSVSAVKTCLLCEASLCDKHLKKHSPSPEHVLVEPTASLESRKCSIHKEVLKYYCLEDSTCICVTCCLVGEHRGHPMELIDHASEKKKIRLRTVLEQLASKVEQAERNVQILQRKNKNAQKKLTNETERITALVRDLRKQLEDLEKKILSEISKQEEQLSSSFSDLIQQLESKKEELTKKMGSIKELCNHTDSLAVLRESIDFCHPEEVEEQDMGKGGSHDVGHLDKNLIWLTLLSGLSDIMSRLKKEVHLQEAVDLSLDISTVSNGLQVADDLKGACYSKSQGHPESPERFEDCQVLSIQRFSSGQHFWEVETGKTGNWMIGVAYASIERKGERSFLGNNNQSWCLCKGNNKSYAVMHDGKTIQLPDKFSCQRLVILLDYKDGRLSFFELGEAIKHLYTFSAAFTQPLHAAFYIWDKWIKIRR